MNIDRGVASVPPPANIMSTLNAQIDAALSTLPKDEDGVFILDVRTKKNGAIEGNVAIVKKFGTKFDIDATAWFGKTWGDPLTGNDWSAGVTVRGKL